MEVVLGLVVIAAVIGIRYWVKFGGTHTTHCPYCREPKSQFARVCPHCHKTQPGYEEA